MKTGNHVKSIFLSLISLFFAFCFVLPAFGETAPSASDAPLPTTLPVEATVPPDSPADEADIPLSLHIELEKNLIFSKYNVVILLDGNQLGILEQGQSFRRSVLVEEGPHILAFCKEKDPTLKSVTQFYISYDSSYECTLASKWNTIEINDEKWNHSPYSVYSLSREEFLLLCSDFSFEELSRTPEKYEGRGVRISGEVVSVKSLSQSRYYELQIRDIHDRRWALTYFLPLGQDRILRGDKVSCLGIFQGMINSNELTYVDQIPSVWVHFLDLAAVGVGLTDS